MAVGLNFRGKIVSATPYNPLDGFRGSVQTSRLERFNTAVFLQDNATPRTAQITSGSISADGKCCSIYYTVQMSHLWTFILLGLSKGV